MRILGYLLSFNQYRSALGGPFGSLLIPQTFGVCVAPKKCPFCLAPSSAQSLVKVKVGKTSTRSLYL